MQIGFLGLGQMGQGMAGNLLRAGYQVSVYNRSAGRDHALLKHGAKRAHSPAEAAHGAAVITMLANDPALEAVTFGAHGLLAALPKGALHISCGTISVALSERLAKAHAAAGQRFVAAPVFGRPDAAAAAKLYIAAAGDPAALQDCAPLFAVLGQRTFHLGPHPPTANLVKLSGNFLIAAAIEAMGEAMALVAKAGVDRHAYLELITTLFPTPLHKLYGGMIADARFEPAGFTAALGQKDIRLTLAAAEALHVPLPLASLLRDRFLALIAAGGEKLDWSAIGKLATRDSGQ